MVQALLSDPLVTSQFRAQACGMCSAFGGGASIYKVCTCEDIVQADLRDGNISYMIARDGPGMVLC